MLGQRSGHRRRNLGLPLFFFAPGCCFNLRLPLQQETDDLLCPVSSFPAGLSQRPLRQVGRRMETVCSPALAVTTGAGLIGNSVKTGNLDLGIDSTFLEDGSFLHVLAINLTSVPGERFVFRRPPCQSKFVTFVIFPKMNIC